MKLVQRELIKNLKRYWRGHLSFRRTKSINFVVKNGVYPYEYMDEWGKFNETSLPENEEFYSNVNMEYITDVNHIHPEKVCRNFEIKNLVEYQDL